VTQRSELEKKIDANDLIKQTSLSCNLFSFFLSFSLSHGWKRKKGRNHLWATCYHTKSICTVDDAHFSYLHLSPSPIYLNMTQWVNGWIYKCISVCHQSTCTHTSNIIIPFPSSIFSGFTNYIQHASTIIQPAGIIYYSLRNQWSVRRLG